MGKHPLFLAYAAFASVCFFWGTTYLGIRIALETLPPFFLISLRFILSGSLIVAALQFTKIQYPRGRNLWLTAFYGVLVLGVGNSCLTFSERIIPSSLAALFIAVSPIWMVTLETLLPGGDKLTTGTAVGMAVSLLGAGLLVGPDALHQGISGNVVQGFLILQVGGAFWSLGSILQRRLKAEINPIASASIQQLAAGLFFLPATFFEKQPVHWDVQGVATLLYLVLFGSIVGYTSYIIALARLPVAIVSLYTYINPIVAAVLGWIAYREPFGHREIAAMLVIFAGVAIVKRYGHPR